MEFDGMGNTPLHRLGSNPSVEVSAMREMVGVVPPRVWRVRGRQGTALHALCGNSAVSGDVLRAASECWSADDYIAWLQTDILGRTPVQVLAEACHDVESAAGRPLPNRLVACELDYADYHTDGLDVSALKHHSLLLRDVSDRWLVVSGALCRCGVCSPRRHARRGRSGCDQTGDVGRPGSGRAERG